MTSTCPSNAKSLMQKFDSDAKHATHVTHITMQLFAHINNYYDLQKDSAEILEVAALLHDVGHTFSPDGKDHHIHSEKFILSQNWPGWDERKKIICARVARYHRKKIPEADMASSSFSKSEKSMILSLAAILRVGDALDRSHTQTVKRVELKKDKNLLRLVTQPELFGQEEIYGVNKKKDLWELHFGKLVVN